jgi:hypothetical protein
VKPTSHKSNFNNINTNKKYELFQDDWAKEMSLYRIRAIRDFDDIKKGEIGGFVEGEHNLSHDGGCWILEPAQVVGSSHVSGNARIAGPVRLNDGIHISGDRCIGFGAAQPGQPHGRSAKPKH